MRRKLDRRLIVSGFLFFQQLAIASPGAIDLQSLPNRTDFHDFMKSGSSLNCAVVTSSAAVAECRAASLVARMAPSIKSQILAASATTPVCFVQHGPYRIAAVDRNGIVAAQATGITDSPQLGAELKSLASQGWTVESLESQALQNYRDALLSFVTSRIQPKFEDVLLAEGQRLGRGRSLEFGDPEWRKLYTDRYRVIRSHTDKILDEDQKHGLRIRELSLLAVMDAQVAQPNMLTPDWRRELSPKFKVGFMVSDRSSRLRIEEGQPLPTLSGLRWVTTNAASDVTFKTEYRAQCQKLYNGSRQEQDACVAAIVDPNATAAVVNQLRPAELLQSFGECR